MAETISILALCISLLLLVVQYINQRERRHGEIVQLRSDLLTRLSMIQQRITSVRLHLERARIDLRTTRDSDDKYEAIEQMPSLLESLIRLEDENKKIIIDVESIDTIKANKSKNLLIFQSTQYLVKDMENLMSDSEKNLLKILEEIQNNQDLLKS